MYEEDYRDSSDWLALTPINRDNAYLKDYPALQFFEIYFDTATFDQIEKDVKVKKA